MVETRCLKKEVVRGEMIILDARNASLRSDLFCDRSKSRREYPAAKLLARTRASQRELLTTRVGWIQQ